MQSKRKRVTILMIFLTIVLLWNVIYLLHLWYKYDWILSLISILISLTNVVEALDGLIYDKFNKRIYWIYTGISSSVLIMNFLTCHYIFTGLAAG